jgi:6,7-dimethyl-8-ribityllumazine synthase
MPIAHVLIVEARFHENIGDMLVRGAREALEAAGVTYEHITVPGALEIPAVIKIASERTLSRFDAYVALGCVIRGETYHFEIVSDESARGIGELGVHYGLPVGNGIITAENMEQAIARANPAEKMWARGQFARRCVFLELKRENSKVKKVS